MLYYYVIQGGVRSERRQIEGSSTKGGVKKMAREEQDSAEDSIYSEDFRDSMLEDDEISAFEAGFMAGYEEAST